MKILLTTLNAKYIHSSLALRSIKTYCGDYENYITIEEFTINNEENYILSKLYNINPNIICFSCYIWNIEQILNIINTIKKVMPNIIVILGGPEVSYDSEDIIKNNSNIDIISYGEGEATFLELMQYFINNKGSLDKIDGIVYKNGYNILTNAQRQGLSLDNIPFVYNDNNIKGFENKIIYYETSRGCPYQCQYCLSSIEKGVRFLSLERVYSDLQFFLDHNIKQVKFVDRTFNCNKNHALNIWEYIQKNDNNITNFHFEITADLIDDEIIKFLKTIRTGLFQFEIGIQSTNIETIEYIKRKVDFELLSDIVKKIKLSNNIHQHLDLIAGLPGESYESFKKSFNDVYLLEPEQFQLGFLKLLKGSGLRKDAKKYGLIYKQKAPYEILYNDYIDYKHILKLKSIEEMIETYYNSGKALYTLKYIISFFKSPFDFYENLSQYWENNGYDLVQHSKMELYTILMRFSSEYVLHNIEEIKELLKFDIFLNDNVKTLPTWLEVKKDNILEISIKKFYKNRYNIEKYLPELVEYEYKQISRMSHIEYFKYDIISLINTGISELSGNMILFNYYRKSYILGHCHYYKIQL